MGPVSWQIYCFWLFVSTYYKVGEKYVMCLKRNCVCVCNHHTGRNFYSIATKFWTHKGFQGASQKKKSKSWELYFSTDLVAAKIFCVFVPTYVCMHVYVCMYIHARGSNFYPIDTKFDTQVQVQSQSIVRSSPKIGYREQH